MNNQVLDLLSVSVCSTLVFCLLLMIFKLMNNTINETKKYYFELIVISMFLVPFYQLGAFVFESLPSGKTDSKIVDIEETFIPMLVKGNQIISNRISGDQWNLLFYIWLLVFLLVIGYQSIQYIRCCRILQTSLTELTDSTVLQMYESLRRELNLKNVPMIYYSGYVKMPVLMWNRGYKILLPEKLELNRKSIELILRHELIHYKRKDLWYKYLLNIVAAVHWFNPFMGFLKKEHAKRCELSCDLQVTKVLSSLEKIQYGELILGLCKSPYAKQVQALSFSVNEKEIIKERILIISESEGEKMVSKKIMTKVVVFILAALFCMTAAITYAAGSGAREQKPENTITEEQAKNESTSDSQKQMELSIPIDQIDQVDQALSDPKVKDKEIRTIYVGTTSESKIEKIFKQLWNHPMIDSENVTWGGPSTLVSEKDDYEYKGTITFIFK